MIEYAIFSSSGEREVNEDTVRIFRKSELAAYAFVLADGLGGHGNGKIASQFVTDCIGAAIENADSFSKIFLDECFSSTQELLLDEIEATGKVGMKSTLIVLLIENGIASWGHIGDSRLYCFRDGKKVKRTLDHSVPQMLALAGKIKESEIRHHPSRASLLRAMGGDWDGPEYEIDERHRKIKPGDVFLLCSDGFWEWIDDRTILKTIRKDISTQQCLNEMVAEVTKNGSGKNMDNASAILITVR